MTKKKVSFFCTECGAQCSKWQGKCSDCGTWNTIKEFNEAGLPKSGRIHGYTGASATDAVALSKVDRVNIARFSSGCSELDRVLGGGIVSGSVVLIGGDPGIGKSTLLLQLASQVKNKKVMYISGEESLQQIALRSERMGCTESDILVAVQTCVEEIKVLLNNHRPELVIIDSIQTIYSEAIASAAGSIVQVRETTAKLVNIAKQNNIVIFLVGHVTKEGMIAGPRVLEHMVDTVVYFEGQMDSRYRMLRAVKNRFGAINELGFWAMQEKGLVAVSNPSAIFLAKVQADTPGSTIMVIWEGTRPILAEVQALATPNYTGTNPRRVAVGIDQARLAMILAVLQRHCQIKTYDKDIFINVVGGLKVNETAADLAMAMAIISSIYDRAIPSSQVFFGEIGLGGEVRPVRSGVERVAECAKHGFTDIIMSESNITKQSKCSANVHGFKNIGSIINHFFQKVVEK